MRSARGFAYVTLFSASSVIRAFAMLVGWVAIFSTTGLAFDQSATTGLQGESIFLKVQLDSTVKASKLRTGDTVEGTLSRPVYAGEREVFPAGRRVRLIVGRLERRRRVPNDHWPWVIRVFTPRHENSPTFDSARVMRGDGSEVSLKVSLLSLGQRLEVHAEPKGKAQPQAAADSRKPGPSVATLEAELPAELAGAPSAPQTSNPVTLAAGTEARVMLMGSVSASGSHPGDAVQARLAEPVRVGSQVVLPEGTVLEGKVVRSMRPRWLSRSGSLLLSFTGVTLPGGKGSPVVVSVAGAEVDKGSHTRVDSEGQLRGGRPGKAWMLANLGATAGIAKVTDDGLQLVIEAIASTATDASTAGTGRIVAICASGIFMLTRHGRDVILPKFTEMDVMFDRAATLGEAAK